MQPLVNPNTGKLTRKLKFGLPKGNLNRWDINKGCVRFLMDCARWVITDYEPGKEQNPKIEGKPLDILCTKPKYLLMILEAGDLDMAIIGRDTIGERAYWKFQDLDWDVNLGSITPSQWLSGAWYYDRGREDETGDLGIAERMKKWSDLRTHLRDCYAGHNQHPPKSLEDLEMHPRQIYDMLDLFLGRVNVRIGSSKFFERRYPEDSIPSDADIKIYSAYPNLTYMLFNKLIDKKRISLRDKNHAVQSDSRGAISVFPVASNTETLIQFGLADFVVDSVSSGESFKKNNIVPLGEPIMKNSTAHLYLSGRAGFEYYSAKLDEKTNELTDAIDQFIFELKQASLYYGHSRQDSLYFQTQKVRTAR